MELLAFLIDFILHVDRHLEVFVQTYGAWVYALLFAIVFVETGLVVMPFLPGDSLLFVVGALCGVGLISLPVAMGLLLVAAILGDQCNYSIGRYFGGKTRAGSTSALLIRPMIFTSAMAASPSYWRASCRLCALLPPLWRGWPK
jgi:membrane-associated protein